MGEIQTIKGLSVRIQSVTGFSWSYIDTIEVEIFGERYEVPAIIAQITFNKNTGLKKHGIIHNNFFCQFDHGHPKEYIHEYAIFNKGNLCET